MFIMSEPKKYDKAKKAIIVITEDTVKKLKIKQKHITRKINNIS